MRARHLERRRVAGDAEDGVRIEGPSGMHRARFYGGARAPSV
jgi:hypothetical protein